MFKNIFVQILVFVAIFQFTSFIRETNMLSADEQLPVMANKQNSASIVVPTLDKNTLALAANGKTTVFYFFAPWCDICHMSIGNLQAVYEKNQNIDVIAVALDFSSEQEVENFVSRHQLTFPIALGNEQVKQAFKVPGYPSYYVANSDNVITNKSMGYSTELGLYLRSL